MLLEHVAELVFLLDAGLGLKHRSHGLNSSPDLELVSN